MIKKMQSLYKNQTWRLVQLLNGKKSIGCKCIYPCKEKAFRARGIIFKTRLVAKGYFQKEGIDYSEIFSLIVRHMFIRVPLSIVIVQNLELEQMDVKMAFLYENLEKIFMGQPKGFEELGSEGKVCLLQHSLYGLKQPSRQWYQCFNTYMRSIGLTK